MWESLTHSEDSDTQESRESHPGLSPYTFPPDREEPSSSRLRGRQRKQGSGHQGGDPQRRDPPAQKGTASRASTALTSS